MGDKQQLENSFNECVQVKIAGIHYVAELYPRFKFDEEVVDRYRRNIDELPPIIVQKADSILIDGYHRLVAHQLEGRTEIKAIFEDVPKDHVLWLATKYNARHGLQLSLDEKRILAQRFFQNGFKNELEIAQTLAVSLRTLRQDNWLGDLKSDQKERQDKEILDLFLSCLSEEEIAEKLTISQPTISQRLTIIKSGNLAKINNSPPQSKHIYDVWGFQDCKEYGTEGYPGRVPGQILEGLLYYYTEPFDIVVDPMAGGGTTVDVCKAMLRRVMAFDINPIEAKGIKRWNTTQGFHPDCKRPHFKPKLIFLDPPYFKKKDPEYVDGSISRLDRDSFLHEIVELAKNCYSLLPKGGRTALLMANYLDYDRSEDSLFAQEVAEPFSFLAGFKLEMKIQVPLSTQQYEPHDVSYAKEHRRILSIARELFVFKKNGGDT